MEHMKIAGYSVRSLLSWERGLKSYSPECKSITPWVAPLVGAWIEIEDLLNMKLADMVAPLVGAWIEIEEPEYERLCNMVAPLVGTWIEILQG